MAWMGIRGRAFHDQQQLVPARLRLPGQDAPRAGLFRRGRAGTVSGDLPDGGGGCGVAVSRAAAGCGLCPDLRRRVDRDRILTRAALHRLCLGPAVGRVAARHRRRTDERVRRHLCAVGADRRAGGRDLAGLAAALAFGGGDGARDRSRRAVRPPHPCARTGGRRAAGPRRAAQYRPGPARRE